jgi:heme/copper-type cytochrome/quinol oxidase subunit 2
VLAHLLFWLIAVVFVVGQALLVRAAWRLRRPEAQPPDHVPRSDPRGDLGWTLVTVAATAVMFYAAYATLPS